tara:strand:+ start:129 stop:392 length:264 start_codon:yes stop_codon:yes gene_type:complete
MTRPKLRKVNASKRKKERKLIEEAMKKSTNMMLDMPKECCVCEKAFERDKGTVKTWRVTVREDRIRLTCPPCWGILASALEKIENED